MVPVAEGAHAVGARKVGHALEAAEALCRHVAALPSKQLQLSIEHCVVHDRDVRLHAPAVAGANLVRLAVFVLVASAGRVAQAFARVLVLVEVQQAFE